MKFPLRAIREDFEKDISSISPHESTVSGCDKFWIEVLHF
jgi:hypothetical protein